MEAILAVLLVSYYVGMLAAAIAYAYRAGGTVGAYVTAVMHPPSRRNGIPWLLKTWVKICLWPLILYQWLQDGKPPSPVLYGELAAERLGINPDHAMGFATKWTSSATSDQRRFPMNGG